MNTLLCISLLTLVCSSISKEVLHEKPKWNELSKLFRYNSRPVSANLLQYVKQSLRPANVSDACERSLTHFFAALSKEKLWSIKMADAGGKVPGGVLNGNLMDFGSFEQCLRIRVNNSTKGEEAFRGRYCMVGYQSLLISRYYSKDISRQTYLKEYGQPPEWAMDFLHRIGPEARNVRLWIGTCIPSTCTGDELTEILSHVMKPLGIIPSVAGCDVDESKAWSPSIVACVSVLGFLAAACMVGTILDVLTYTFTSLKFDHYTIVYILKLFSIRVNTVKLFKTQEDNEPFRCFHGIKFIMGIWIIFGHYYALYDGFTYHRFGSAFQRFVIFTPNLMTAIMENTSLNISSFIFMSGFFLMYVEFSKLEKNKGKLSIISFTVQRILRYNISVAFGIIVLIALQVTGSGPLWKPTMAFYVEKCHRNWWANFFYINNFWESEHMCMGPSWYFAALLQLQLIGIFLIILLYRSPFACLALGTILAVGSCLHDVLLVIWTGHIMVRFGPTKEIELAWNYVNNIYYKTPHHVCSFLIGMSVAYIIIKHKDKKLRPVFQIIGWALLFCLWYFALFGIYGPDIFAYWVFYTSFFRIAWALGVGWLTYVCVTGSGGIINRFLSWRPITILGQLSSMTSLLHWVFLVFLKGTQRERRFYSHFECIFASLSIVLIGHFIGYVGYITVEAPLTTLTTIIFRKFSSTKNKSD